MPNFLTKAERDALPDSDFALPGRRYPIHDVNHSKMALTKISQFGTEAEKTIVKSKVKARHPSMVVA